MKDITAYPAYSYSGISWLGQVPDHWEVLPAYAVYRPKLIKNTGMIENTVLSLSYGRIVVKPPEKLHGLVPESFETYQIVHPGNIIVRTTDLQNDHTSLRVGFSNEHGIITSAYMCLETTDRVSSEFGYQFLNTYDLLKVIYGYGSGLRQNLDFDDIKRMPVLVPPKPEQSAIVHFLQYLDRRVRRYVLAKQRLIKLLSEQKQAIIEQAVTRGLQPDIRLKASGLSWQEHVPEHWTVTQLRRHWRVTDCKHLTVPFVERGIPLASVREAQSFDLSLSNAKRTTEEWHKLLIEGGRQPRRGDLIYCRNVSVGACTYVDTTETFAMGQDVCLIRSASQNQRYLNYLLHSSFMQRQLAQVLVGSTFNRINIADVKSLAVLIPPREEQDAIAAYLDSALTDALVPIDRINREIELIREYRIRLIADVVTGKLDVRQAAEQLPDETEEPEELPLADDVLENGERAELTSEELAEEVVS